MTLADTAIDHVILAEGGLSADPADRAVRDLLAGETVHTAYGIRQSSYNAYRRSQGLPTQPVRLIAPTEVRRLYKRDYWDAAGCDAIAATGAEKTATCVFDAAVQHGPQTAVRQLQTVVSATPDGAWGPASTADLVTALHASSDADVADHLLLARQDYYDRIIARDRSQTRFANGWHNRLVKLRRTLGLRVV